MTNFFIGASRNSFISGVSVSSCLLAIQHVPLPMYCSIVSGWPYSIVTPIVSSVFLHTFINIIVCFHPPSKKESERIGFRTQNVGLVVFVLNELSVFKDRDSDGNTIREKGRCEMLCSVSVSISSSLSFNYWLVLHPFPWSIRRLWVIFWKEEGDDDGMMICEMLDPPMEETSCHVSKYSALFFLTTVFLFFT